MTLSTDLYIHDLINPELVYDKCMELMGEDPTTAQVSRDPEGISNERGQDFDALLSIYHTADGRPIPVDPEAVRQPPRHYVRVNWDTSYAGRSKLQGFNCDTLHAHYIVALGRWLDDLECDWSWRNEYTGQIHHKYEGIVEFLGNGANAREWFETVVLPAITAKNAPPGAEAPWPPLQS